MSLLIVELPLRARPGAAAQDAAADAGPAPAADWAYLLSHDGRGVARSGSAAAALLPRADSVVAVLDPADVAWHRAALPRVGAAKLRAAIGGVLEDHLLDEPDRLHFALGPAADGARWVAAVDKPWLAARLAELEAAGCAVDRVVPLLAPSAADAAPLGWFDVDPAAGDTESIRLTLAGPAGVACLRASGSLARQLLPEGAVYSASPAAAAAAERWLGAPVAVSPRAERLLAAAAAEINLRQFDLAPRHRGTRWLRDGWRRLAGRDYRWLRWGLAALVVVQLAGLNLYAWQQQRRIAAQRAAVGDLLKAAHPQVRAVLDAPLQMQRETEALRAAAGRPGAADFETLLAAAAAAWPDATAPAQSLRFEPGRLALVAPGIAAAQLAPLRERLRASGFDAELVDGRLQVFPRGAR